MSSFELLALLSTILEFNPLLQAYKNWKSGSSADVSLATFVLIAVIGSVWLAYGISITSTPLIVGNGIKLFSALAVLVIASVHRLQAK